MIRTSKLLSAAILFLGIVGFLANDAAAQRVSLQAKMASTGVEQKASGKAFYEQKDKNIQFSAEAKGLYVCKMLSVYVAGNMIGSSKVDVDGSADLKMALLGREMHAGDSVEFRNQDGKPVLRGVLRERKTGPLGGKK